MAATFLTILSADTSYCRAHIQVVPILKEIYAYCNTIYYYTLYSHCLPRFKKLYLTRLCIFAYFIIVPTSFLCTQRAWLFDNAYVIISYVHVLLCIFKYGIYLLFMCMHLYIYIRMYFIVHKLYLNNTDGYNHYACCVRVSFLYIFFLLFSYFFSALYQYILFILIR